jgi:nucleotide-binding universal stress UspA family protein
MFKDILAVVGDNRAASPFVVSFAQCFGAEVTAISAFRETAVEAMVAAQTRYDFIQGDRAAATEAAQRGLQNFVGQAAEAGVTAHLVAEDPLEGGATSDLPRFARCFDLAVLEQPDPARSRFGGGLIASLLSGSGRPVIVAPYIQKGAVSFDLVAVAWDASASAARALGDALPILKRAKAVEVVAVTPAGSKEEPPNGARVTRHLASHGINAVFHVVPSEIDAGNMLLSHIADSGADFLIAGGYGHSRLGEAILGGVTRTLLESMTVPVFMSH